MADLVVEGGRPLEGAVRPSGNKNAVLPLLCASLLTDEPVTLTNVPEITDVDRLVEFLEQHGSKVDRDRSAGTLRVDHTGFDAERVRSDLPEGMRSSVLLYAPLLHRCGRLQIRSNTPGCSLGIRELDPHLALLARLGAVVSPGDPTVVAVARRFVGARHWADYMSVTATESFLMAAVVAEGTSELINAASEPHVQDLCAALVAMGARIEGAGTSRLRIEGVASLRGGTFAVSPDYHEIATFLALGAITGGEVAVEPAVPEHFDLIARSFGKVGVEIVAEGSVARVRRARRLVVETPFTPNLLPRIEAAPWPYFPVDLLPLVIALAVRAEGAVQFWNKVYEGGFSWLPELGKFGAHAVVCDPHRVIVFGQRPLRPAVVESPYIIRAAVALFMVAASIPGRSVVQHAEVIRRAHPRFLENLRSLGADVSWQ